MSYLNIQHSDLTELPSYDNDLVSLRCDFSQLTSLDGIENTKIRYLTCGENKLTSIPKLNKLVVLDFAWNNIRQHPYICGGLVYLDNSYNPIEEVPKLPYSLKQFHCCGTNITVVPDLPNNLEWFSCFGNQLVEQTIKLPKSLKHMEFSSDNKTIFIHNGQEYHYFPQQATDEYEQVEICCQLLYKAKVDAVKH